MIALLRTFSVYYSGLCSLVVFLSLSSSTVFAQNAPPPNIVFLLADDLGYGDLACYGAPDVKTPNLDRLAKQGVRFTQHYSNGPECSPTRTALLTGRYQQWVGGLECAIGTGNVGRYDDAERLAKQHELGLPANWATLPQALKQAGYSTAIFGKWHLGYEEKFNPQHAGFDTFFGCLGGYVDYFTHRELSPLPVLYRQHQPVDEPGYLTHLVSQEAVRFLEKKHTTPFFLYVPFTSPHFPFQTPQDDQFELTETTLTQGTREKYIELVQDLDTQVGRILQALQQGGFYENTLVVFASDNGAMKPGRNLPLSNYKSTVYEGGIRVPLIARWPGKLPSGQVSHQPCITMDLTASFLHAAGAKLPSDRPLEGIDVVGQVAAGKPEVSRTLFWRGRRGDRTDKAVRDGNWKYLHRQLDAENVEEGLYDLSKDIAEQHNLLSEQPQQAAHLKKLLAAWEARVKSQR